ncbi:tetratricopeptide repeat protein [Flavobacteriales bacterium]|nr:tetratricopeptide repeat protein [Flavobacteriales bacterium]
MQHFKNIWLPMLLVFLLAVSLYSNTSTHDYAWDDAIVLVENDRVQKGLSNIPELFENIKSTETEHRYGYRPIALLSFAADVHFFGMNPKAAHKVNIILYGILCIIVLFFLNTFFPGNRWRNFFIAALFVVHPLHTEVVGNIKSRDEILAMIFGLTGLLYYGRAYLNKTPVFYGLSMICMILAFHSKESAVTFCGISFILPWYLGAEKKLKAKLVAGLPAVAFVATILAIRFYVYSEYFFQSTDFELTAKGLFHQDGFVGNPLVDYGWMDKLGMAFYLVPFFIYKFLWPHPLVHDYSFNQLDVFTWADWQVWLALPFSFAIVVLGIYGLIKGKSYGFGILFFLISASVYLHVIQPAPDIFGERFMFVPSLGLCIMFITLFEFKLDKRWLMVAAGLLLIPQMVYTYQRNEAWKNNETLLLTDLVNQPNCVRANYNYGLMLHGELYNASPKRKKELIPQILKSYEHTVSLTDRLLNAELDLAAAYMEFNMPDKAYPMFISLTERYPNISTPYVQIGKYHMSFQQYSEALVYFEKALEKGMANSDYHYLMSICQFNTGKREEAIATLLEGEKLGVSSPAYFSLEARLYMKMNQVDFAIFSIERGLRQFPSDTQLKEGLIKLRNTKD